LTYFVLASGIHPPQHSQSLNRAVQKTKVRLVQWAFVLYNEADAQMQ